MTAVTVGRHAIGNGNRCFVIAEAGVNHNGDPELAHQLVDAAADSGADAVKFQTFNPEALAARDAPVAAYQEGTTAGRTQREMLSSLTLPASVYRELKAQADERGLTFLSSPFDEESVDYLLELGVPALKIPSGELTNHPLLRHAALGGVPLLVSTGMATLAEVEDAVAVIRAAGCIDLVLFHCVSAYPAAAADSNLQAMETMRMRFGVPVGWSDHTLGINVSIAAAALGAATLEKHLTLRRDLPGPDHGASLEPAEFARLVNAVREAESALGSGAKQPVAAEMSIAAVARKSLHARTTLARGHVMRSDDFLALRPATGIPPSKLPDLLGRRLSRPVQAGAALSGEDFE